MWNRWQIRVGISLAAGPLLFSGGMLIVAAAFTGWMGATPPWWAYVMAGIGLGLLILSPSLVLRSLNKNLGCGFSVLLGLLSLVVIGVAMYIWEVGGLNALWPICSTCQDTRQISFPILLMTAFLVVSSGSVKDSRSVVALILALLIAFVITLSGERAMDGIVIEGRPLSLPFVLLLFPSLAFSLSTLLNLGIREKLRPPVILLSSVVVIVIALVVSLGLGRAYTML